MYDKIQYKLTKMVKKKKKRNKEIPENSKKQNLNLPHTGRYIAFILY